MRFDYVMFKCYLYFISGGFGRYVICKIISRIEFY